MKNVYNRTLLIVNSILDIPGVVIGFMLSMLTSTVRTTILVQIEIFKKRRNFPKFMAPAYSLKTLNASQQFYSIRNMEWTEELISNNATPNHYTSTTLLPPHPCGTRQSSPLKTHRLDQPSGRSNVALISSVNRTNFMSLFM